MTLLNDGSDWGQIDGLHVRDKVQLAGSTHSHSKVLITPPAGQETHRLRYDTLTHMLLISGPDSGDPAWWAGRYAEKLLCIEVQEDGVMPPLRWHGHLRRIFCILLLAFPSISITE